MRLVLPLRPEWTAQQLPIGLRVEVVPGLRFLVDPPQPVPFNTLTWCERIVLGGLPAARVKMISVEDLTTAEGWPFTFVVSDELGKAGPVERRIHAIVRIAQHAVIVTARSLTAAAMDGFAAEFRRCVVHSRADFTDVVTSLDQIWTGLDMVDALPPPPEPSNPTNE